MKEKEERKKSNTPKLIHPHPIFFLYDDDDDDDGAPRSLKLPQ